MSEQLITQCPKCSTSFRINDAQLSAAKGAVRCGACLTVFSALDNLVSDNTPPSIARANDKSEPPDTTPNVPENTDASTPTEYSPEQEASADQFTTDDEVPEEHQAPLALDDSPPPTEESSEEESSEEKSTSEEATPETSSQEELGEVGAFEIEEDAPVAEQNQQQKDQGSNEPDIGEPETSESDEGLFDADDLFEATKEVKEEEAETAADDGLFEFDENELADLSEDSAVDSTAAEKAKTTEIEEQDSLEVDPEEILQSDDIDDDALFEDSPEEKAAVEAPFDEEEEKEAQSSETLEDDFSDTFLRIDSDQDTEFFGEANDSTQVTRISTEADESWTEALLEDEDTKQAGDISSDDLELAPTTELERHQQAEINETPEFKETPKEEPLVATREPEVQDVLSNLEASPVEFHAKSKSNIPWGNILNYGLGSLACCLLLLLEYAWYDFYNLSRNPTLRPWYTSACNILPCELPAMVDVSKIRSANLVIRSHPKNKKALVVDVIITNNANFEQPFPLLELTFSDFSDQIVASRRFKPYEYLDGELAGAQLMPAQTPIHIALEIYDPGKTAVNYHLAFHPTDAR